MNYSENVATAQKAIDDLSIHKHKLEDEIAIWTAIRDAWTVLLNNQVPMPPG